MEEPVREERADGGGGGKLPLPWYHGHGHQLLTGHGKTCQCRQRRRRQPWTAFGQHHMLMTRQGGIEDGVGCQSAGASTAGSK